MIRLTEENKELSCSFCGFEIDEEEDLILIKGIDDVYICNFCAEECANISYEKLTPVEPKKIKRTDSNKKINLRPSAIKAHLDEYVIGQEKAKEILSVAISNHYKILNHKEKNKELEIEKSNVLMLGPTGSGKTFLLKTLAKYVDVPIAIVDSTGLTESGYVGEDVESSIKKLLSAADFDVERAEKGIVFFDEGDKLTRRGENMSVSKDVGGEGVQQAILKMVEGTVVDVPPEGGRKHPNQECIEVDTTNILFIFGGSFEGIEKIISKRQNKVSTIGFGGTVYEKSEIKINDTIEDVKVEDLKKFGMIPELLGRFPIISPLKELDEDDLVRILTEPKNALLKQYEELFRIDGVKLIFKEEAVREVAKLAIERKTGARALRGILEDILHEYMYSVPDEKDIIEVIITKDAVLTKGKAIINRKTKVAL